MLVHGSLCGDVALLASQAGGNKMQSQIKRSMTFVATPQSPLQTWLRDFLSDVRAANRSDATIEFYADKLQRFLAYLDDQAISDPRQLSAPVLREYLLQLGESHTSGGVHAYWRAIRAIVRFLVREEAIDRNPLDKMRSPKLDQELLDPVPLETISALLETCDKSILGKRDKAIILTLLDTGLRAGEMTALNIGDIDLNDGSVTVYKSKGRKGRFSFVGRRARKAIAAYLRTRQEDGSHQPLWLSYQRDGERTRLQYDGLRDIVRRRAKQAGVAPPSLHGFRRSFAITMLRNGADLVSLSRMMGHGSLPVLTRYLKQIKEDLSEVHAQHSPADTLL
jgi:integrase/recombinase XerC